MSTQKQRTPEEIQQDLHEELGRFKTGTLGQPDPTKIDKKRYRKVRWFFAKAFIHVIFWDIILNRPILRWFRTPSIPRWQKIARNFRGLAVEMGGVLIKLGQFLSIRVDILPTEVTRELAGLQDEVPPEQLADLIAQIEADFRRPVAELFAWIDPEPLGAASLGQAHLARLAGTNEEVVIKALRPGIDILVETDLAAIALALRWLKWYGRISKRVDLDWLAKEFTTVTRNELDFHKEGQNAERFAKDFADNPNLYVPKVYWEHTAARTLTLENVGYIKIGDLEGIEAAGISRPQVAHSFYEIYMRQVFMTNFVHADPHPGNVFVKPLPTPTEIEAGINTFPPGAPVPYHPDRPFQMVLVDFGMTSTIPERLRSALREYAIGIGTRDAYKIVQSYVNAGVLLPGADLKRLEEMHEAIFERFWGVRVGDMQNVALSEANFFVREYRDIIYDAPFQFQVDMLFTVRAISILSGMALNLDENFDPWSEAIPFAEQFAAEELQQNWQGWLGEFTKIGQTLFKFPDQVDRVLTLAQRGNLVIQTTLSPDSRKLQQRLEQAINRLTWVLLAIGLLVSGVILRTTEDRTLGGLMLVLAVVAFLWGMLRRV